MQEEVCWGVAGRGGGGLLLKFFDLPAERPEAAHSLIPLSKITCRQQTWGHHHRVAEKNAGSRSGAQQKQLRKAKPEILYGVSSEVPLPLASKCACQRISLSVSQSPLTFLHASYNLTAKDLFSSPYEVAKVVKVCSPRLGWALARARGRKVQQGPKGECVTGACHRESGRGPGHLP